MEILKNEDVYVESVVLDRVGEDDYLIYFIKEIDSTKSNEAFERSARPLDIQYRQYKQRYWQEKVRLDLF